MCVQKLCLNRFRYCKDFWENLVCCLPAFRRQEKNLSFLPVAELFLGDTFERLGKFWVPVERVSVEGVDRLIGWVQRPALQRAAVSETL